jgi:hypothetical protein
MKMPLLKFENLSFPNVRGTKESQFRRTSRYSGLLGLRPQPQHPGTGRSSGGFYNDINGQRPSCLIHMLSIFRKISSGVALVRP